MPSPPRLSELGPLPKAYLQLQDQLAQTSWICHGSLVCRPLLRTVGGRKLKKGPYYLWTAKVKGKTVCVALSKAQYQLLRQAIKNNRPAQKLLAQMQTLTFRTILRKIPGVKKRK